ncbi:MAG: ABC transporter permease, partial [Stackebrandtia sp.]
MVAISPVRKIGRAVSNRTARFAGSADLPIFLGRVLYHLFFDIILRRKYGRTLAKQVSDITVGVGALVIGGGMIFVIATMSLATGAMVGLQGYPGLERIGAEAFTGLVASYSNVREVTPIIAGVALVAQVGTGFTAEIGAMRISEEIDALEVMGINSLAYLVCTRVAAGVIALVPLYLVSLFMAFFATRFITTQYFGLSPGIYDYYFHLYLPPIDVLYSVIKVAVFAFIVMFIHCYRGYYAAGGPVGVGVAAGRAIRESTILMILMNLVLSY